MKLALILLVVPCIGGATYALAPTGLTPPSPANGQGAAASKSARSLSIRVEPATRSVARGATVRFTVRIRHRGRRRVRLSVLDGVPPGGTASFDPSSTRKKKATLTVVTTGAPSGGYRLRLLARSRARRATAEVNLVINSPQPTNFTISGDLSRPLEPGLAVPLDLALTNPGPVDIAISGLAVSVGSVIAPLADAAYACTVADFSVIQFSGAFGFTLGPSSTHHLSELGFPAEQWPKVVMLNRPVNQNGCKGASLQFDYTGTGSGS